MNDHEENVFKNWQYLDFSKNNIPYFQAIQTPGYQNLDFLII